MRSSPRLLLPRRGTPRLRGRVVALNLVLALLAVLAPTALIPAGAAQPSSVSFSLEGCRNNGDVSLPNADGDFICDDSAYTPGNLGKGWNELDLVPYRITADAGTSAPASQTYSVSVVLDREDVTRPGYDVLSVPVLNTELSDALCNEPVVGAQTTLDPGLGGIDLSIYRLVTITQVANTTCVYDYYGRLALGSHLFPGSSLHANLANEGQGTAGIGSKDVSIPVKEILPQELSKAMTASQGSDHVWNVTKTAGSVSFADTCLASPAGQSLPVSTTVRWERLPASPNGDITVITNITATNPASRVITVTVEDQLYTGTQPIGGSVLVGTHEVPAGGAWTFTYPTTVPAGTPLVDNMLNDVATATYTDLVTGIAVPGNTTAKASAAVQLSDSESNQTAIITDVESITGSGFSYSVNSFTGATGAFTGGYVAGTRTTGSVSWRSASQTATGSVTFLKTVYATAGLSGDGILSDTATLVGSSGYTTTASASVNLRAFASVRLTINKTIPNVLTGDETASFDFDLYNQGVLVADSRRTIDFSAGETTGSVTVSGLAPGTYTVHEVVDASGQWAPQVDKSVTIALPDCAGSVAFANIPNPLGISLDKEVNGDDHATADDALLVHAGDALTYDVVITNTGLVPLTITSLTDTLRDPDFDGTCTQGIGSILAPGDSFTCTYPMTAAGDVTNMARVIGIDGLQREVTADDSTFVDVINPAIQVVKTVDDDSPEVGQTVTYTYVVTNTGDTTLSNVTVVDDVLGAIGTIDTLAPGASSTLTKAVVVTIDTPSRNVALATGTDVLGKQVTDDDDATIETTAVLGIVLEQLKVLPAVLPTVLPALLPALLPTVLPMVLPALLPRTGMAISGILLIGLALLFGGLTLRAARKRQPQA